MLQTKKCDSPHPRQPHRADTRNTSFRPSPRLYTVCRTHGRCPTAFSDAILTTVPSLRAPPLRQEPHAAAFQARPAQEEARAPGRFSQRKTSASARPSLQGFPSLCPVFPAGVSSFVRRRALVRQGPLFWEHNRREGVRGAFWRFAARLARQEGAGGPREKTVIKKKLCT